MSITHKKRKAISKLEILKKKIVHLDQDEVDTVHDFLTDLEESLGIDDLLGDDDSTVGVSVHHDNDEDDGDDDVDLFDHITTDDDDEAFGGGETGGGGASSNDW
jgi:hypothetical protein